jgi:hypothetical protein
MRFDPFLMIFNHLIKRTSQSMMGTLFHSLADVDESLIMKRSFVCASDLRSLVVDSVPAQVNQCIDIIVILVREPTF